MSRSDADDNGWRGSGIGTKLKSTRGWDHNGNGTNESGFSALPGCYRYCSEGSFSSECRNGDWWLAAPGGSGDAWDRRLYYGYDEVHRDS